MNDAEELEVVLQSPTAVFDSLSPEEQTIVEQIYLNSDVSVSREEFTKWLTKSVGDNVVINEAAIEKLKQPQVLSAEETKKVEEFYKKYAKQFKKRHKQNPDGNKKNIKKQRRIKNKSRKTNRGR